MKVKTDYTELVDFLFWITFIFFTNPGGILEAFGEDRGDGGINVTDFLFVGMCFLYATIYFKDDRGRNEDFYKTVKYFVFFLLYYFIIFGYLVPIFKDTSSSTFMFVFIKSRQTIYSVCLFIMVYSFFIRSSKLFFNLLFISSFIVLSLFLF